MPCCGSGSRGKIVRSHMVRPRDPVNAQQLQAVSLRNFRASFLMCRPRYYGIDYSINPWMNMANGADHALATAQWAALEAILKKLGARIRKVSPHEDQPDMVFTANAGLVLKDGRVLISSFKHPERKGEEALFLKWFADNRFSVIQPSATFEGAGDALYFGDLLIGGWGFRSDPGVYQDITDRTVQLVDPHFYHLDTCFCPLMARDYLIWPGAFSEDGLATIRSIGFNEIVVPEEEAHKFACNAICVDKDVVLPSGCHETVAKLLESGYRCHPVDMSEFIKAGGACKCLTLALQ